MGIQIKDTFPIKAAIDDVWSFLLDAERVVQCMPGAELEEAVDSETFIGTIKVKVGPVVTRYQGRVQFVERNEAAHTVRLTAEGREKNASGSARGTMSSTLRALSEAETEVSVESDVEVTGKVMQFGRGMVEGVSMQLFQQFVECARARLEAGAASGAAEPSGETTPPREAEPISAIPLALGVLWRGILNFFRRLFGRGRERR